MLKCDFCGRPANEVRGLVAPGNGNLHLCDGCAEEAHSTFQQTAPMRTTGQATPKAQQLLKPVELKGVLDQHVIGQESCKESVAVAVYNHYKRRNSQGTSEVEIQKSNIMMMGPSGTGKTEIARSIARTLGVPYHKHDASKLTQAGYVGNDVENILQGLLGASDGSLEEAQWGIVFLDEFDKLARKSGRGASGHRDVNGEGVQQALLTLIEGSSLMVPTGMHQSVMMDTSNILFICAGSFDGIQETVSRRMRQGTKRVGFGTADPVKELTLTEAYENVQEDDILEFGIIPELAGRLPVVTSTLPLTESEMLRILTEPQNSLTKQYQALMRMDGIQLEFDDEALKMISSQARKSPKGARALRGSIERILRRSMLTLPGSKGTLRVTAESVTTNEPTFTAQATV